ncbi:ScbA/BarX family gamma-butyrolactone biosynthesis protein [Streptomyces triticirhizae]|uniref:Gamma-butyrolactone biosynthesis protein n=1 Tax=Streptomyces triticirhizae TaxID=2483353 RepID=A0A3M2LX63_9ACTN|nr:ScbA/BarX family gamma-butyrolactone biosynthesis protein [Streptomyces triticirhizae]RMI40625.1 gamma-butyrolactone biosynthesis protein [Streptomyces triticirhizae]
MCALALADHATTAPSLSAEPELFLQTVPRTLVHRAAVSEVLLTGIREGGTDTFLVGAQWPRGHSYYGSVGNRWHDPMLLAETIRQAVLLISHQKMGIPLDYHFLSHATSYEVDPSEVLMADRPADVLLVATLTGIRRRGTTVAGFEVNVECHRDGRLLGQGHMSMTCVPETTYRRLRGARADARAARPAAPVVPPESVGRNDESDVVLTLNPRDGAWALVADPDHPVLFDHPVDHVPGMVVLEGARQAALATLNNTWGVATGCSVTFERFVEFDAPCLVTVGEVAAGPDGEQVVPVDFAQGGSTAASASVAVRTGP